MSVAELALPTAIGILLWGIGVAVIHWLPMGLDGGTAQAVTYALSVPTGWLTVETIARAAPSLAIDPLTLTVRASIIGLLLNAIAIGFAPELYRGAGATTMFGAAWLFWILAIILFLAERRRGA